MFVRTIVLEDGNVLPGKRMAHNQLQCGYMSKKISDISRKLIWAI